MVERGGAVLGTGRLLEDGESDWANTSWGAVAGGGEDLISVKYLRGAKDQTNVHFLWESKRGCFH